MTKVVFYVSFVLHLWSVSCEFIWAVFCVLWTHLSCFHSFELFSLYCEFIWAVISRSIVLNYHWLVGGKGSSLGQGETTHYCSLFPRLHSAALLTACFRSTTCLQVWLASLDFLQLSAPTALCLLPCWWNWEKNYSRERKKSSNQMLLENVPLLT